METFVNPFICPVKAVVHECSVRFLNHYRQEPVTFYLVVRFDASWLHERSLSVFG